LGMVRGAKTRFPRLGSCSFDKGFYTPANLEQLAQELALVILPKRNVSTTLRHPATEISEHRGT